MPPLFGGKHISYDELIEGKLIPYDIPLFLWGHIKGARKIQVFKVHLSRHDAQDKFSIVFHSAESQRTHKKRNIHGGKEDNTNSERENINTQELADTRGQLPPLYGGKKITYDDLTKGNLITYDIH